MTAQIAYILTLAGAIAMLACGCDVSGRIDMVCDDVVGQPGQTVHVQPRLLRQGWSRYFPPPDPPPIMIYRDNQCLGQLKPAGTDVVTVALQLDKPGPSAVYAIYQPRPGRQPISAISGVFCWDSTRVAIAVDLDRVVSRVTAAQRLAGESLLGEVHDGSAEILCGLAREFNLLYLTELPAEQKTDVRRWLKDRRLPNGPIIRWRRADMAGVQQSEQAAVLRRVREAVPTLLIGVGDGNDDLAAFGRNGMLPLMLDFSGTAPRNPTVPRLATWKELWQFFMVPNNRPIISNPRTMLELHAAGGNYMGGMSADK